MAFGAKRAGARACAGNYTHPRTQHTQWRVCAFSLVAHSHGQILFISLEDFPACWGRRVRVSPSQHQGGPVAPRSLWPTPARVHCRCRSCPCGAAASRGTHETTLFARYLGSLTF
jgi:hypothetical protein